MFSVDEYLKNSQIKIICESKKELKKSYLLIKAYGLCHKKFNEDNFLNELFVFCLKLQQNKNLKLKYTQAFFLINEIEKK